MGATSGKGQSGGEGAKAASTCWWTAPSLVKGKQKVTVRFQAQDGAAIPGVFGIRTVRADAAR